jgi:hypothetical protein
MWRDFLTPAGEASEWTTALVAAALHAVGADADPLRRAAAALLARQNEDGGWGYNDDVPTDADSTACALLFLSCIGADESACARAASCLAAHRRGDGGVATYREAEPIRRYMGVGRWMRFSGWCRSHTEVTATAGRALGSFAPAAAACAWEYVRARQEPDGSWRAYWWTSPHYSTLQGALLAAARGDAPAVARAAAWAARPVDPLPAFAAAAGLSTLALGDDQAARARAVARLLALQEADGGWPSGPILRIPTPGDVDPDRRRLRPLGRGIVVADQHRTVTTAFCVAALAAADRLD